MASLDDCLPRGDEQELARILRDAHALQVWHDRLSPLQASGVHDVASSCVVEILKAGPDDAIPSRTFQLRCTHCFADYGRGDPRAWNSIFGLSNKTMSSAGKQFKSAR